MKERIRKLQSTNYSKIIEVRVPVRFYWNVDDFDGIEFGPLTGRNKRETRLLKQVVNQLHCLSCQSGLVDYLSEFFPEEWEALLEYVVSKSSGQKGTPIPNAFLDAFRENR